VGQPTNGTATAARLLSERESSSDYSISNHHHRGWIGSYEMGAARDGLVAGPAHQSDSGKMGGGSVTTGEGGKGAKVPCGSGGGGAPWWPPATATELAEIGSLSGSCRDADGEKGKRESRRRRQRLVRSGRHPPFC
jgi:hypothetical protein